jgi:hypothetical protein
MQRWYPINPYLPEKGCKAKLIRVEARNSNALRALKVVLTLGKN